MSTFPAQPTTLLKEAPRSPKALLSQWLLWPLREIFIGYQFIRNDLTVTIVPTSLLMGLALFQSEVTLFDGLLRFASGLVYFSLFIYTFCLSNQLVGLAEDRINKPDRPLPSGLVSKEGARRRYVAATILFLAFAGWLSVLPWALSWVLITVVHNFTAAGKNWFVKSCLLMGLGVWVQLAAGWALVDDHGISEGLPWIVVVATVVFVGTPIQDLRDVEGDQAIGRKTFPIVFGMGTSRIILAIVFVLLGLGTSLTYLWLIGFSLSLVHLACLLLLLGWNGWIAHRVLSKRTPKQDDKTYKLFALLYCLLIVVGFTL